MRFGILWRRSVKPHQDRASRWRSLRTSRATWMIEGGANPKDVQGQMRHSRIQITLDVYEQFVPDSQRSGKPPAQHSTRLGDLRSYAHVEPRTMEISPCLV